MLTVSPIVGRGNAPAIDYTKIFDPYRPWSKINGILLPHWEQEGTIQFVTLHLADSMPSEKLFDFMELRSKFIAENPKPWNKETLSKFEKIFDHNIDKWLQMGHGECILKRSTASKIVESALRYQDGKNIELYEYVIMPNHIHFLASTFQCSMFEVVKAIKNFTASQINRFYNRKGRLWHRDYFDRLIRSVNDYVDKAEYIRHNPYGK